MKDKNNDKSNVNIKEKFFKYISLNIMGMIGLSCYIIADSYFIAKSQGAYGLTALNLVLPVYNVIFAIGLMIGVGSSIRYAIAKSEGKEEAKLYFFNAVFFAVIIGLVFSVVGILMPDKLLRLLGADEEIVQVGKKYTSIFMSFAPMFMCNHIFNAYVRNDNAPFVSMVATLCSSIFNIIFDYVLMFPLGMGMPGAALATALSPVVGIVVCLSYLCSKKSSVVFKLCRPSLKRLYMSCKVGVAAFVTEMSSCIITLIFNFLILGLAGNIGVAAYGVIANIAFVTIAVYNGISQGSQPLISTSYGKGNKAEVILLRNMSMITAFIASVVLYVILYFGAEGLVALFNSENDMLLKEYAVIGVKLYFTGIFFAGLNIVGSNYFSAIAASMEAFVISVLRGFVCVVIFAFLLSYIAGMNGIWLTNMVSELCTCVVMVIMIIRIGHKKAPLN